MTPPPTIATAPAAALSRSMSASPEQSPSRSAAATARVDAGTRRPMAGPSLTALACSALLVLAGCQSQPPAPQGISSTFTGNTPTAQQAAMQPESGSGYTLSLIHI